MCFHEGLVSPRYLGNRRAFESVMGETVSDPCTLGPLESCGFVLREPDRKREALLGVVKVLR